MMQTCLLLQMARMSLQQEQTPQQTLFLSSLLPLTRLLMKSLWCFYFGRCCNKAEMKTMARRETFTQSYCYDLTLLCWKTDRFCN
jgi:hypothetical protein